MTFSFTIANYKSKPGENLYITGSTNELGNNDPLRAVPLVYINGLWTGTVKFTAVYANATYEYFSNTNCDPLVRQLPPPIDNQILYIKDDWAPLKTDPWYCKALETVFPYMKAKTSRLITKSFEITDFSTTVIFRLFTAYPAHSAEISGVFSEWEPQEMQYIGDRTWELIIEFAATSNVEYKFLVDYEWEAGENRTLGDLRGVNLVSHFFKYSEVPLVKIAGVAVPLFSVPSDGKICADFTDLIAIGEFCTTVGFNTVELLPVNDTTQSYPYSVSSSFALNPVYLDVSELGDLPDFEVSKDFDYTSALAYKDKAARAWFSKHNNDVTRETVNNWLGSSELVRFWLPAYCIYRMLALEFKTYDFHIWGSHAVTDALREPCLRFSQRQELFLRLFRDSGKLLTSSERDEITFQAIMEYQLHNQLSKTSASLLGQGVFLMGDMPVGVSSNSCDCWAYPELFSLDRVLGAPPDGFSQRGENWGFPVFKFEADGKNEYIYTKMRFEASQQYFKSVRIDHILGWFRTWEIDVENPKGDGRLGIFQPAHPLQWHELESAGIGDRKLLQPQINAQLLQCQESDLEYLIELGILKKEGDDSFKMVQPAQQALEDVDETELSEEEKRYFKDIIYNIVANQCLIPDDNCPQCCCHPVFENMLETTACSSFKALSEHDQETIRELSYDYYNVREIDLWRSNGRKNLNLIQKFTNQLVIGENLGFSGEYVIEEMRNQGLIGMWVMQQEADPQLLSIDNKTYASTGTHDCPSLRGFFDENTEHAKHVYEKLLKRPYRGTASSEDLEEIVRMIMKTNALLTVFPIQDLIACSMTSDVDPELERINNPSDPKWVWKYRMPIGFKQLAGNIELAGMLKVMTKESGRWHE